MNKGDDESIREQEAQKIKLLFDKAKRVKQEEQTLIDEQYEREKRHWEQEQQQQQDRKQKYLLQLKELEEAQKL
jgi:F0F1-type ATP synthase epsilon subunit